MMKEVSRAKWIWWCMMMVVMVMPSSSHSWSSTIEETGISKHLGYNKVTFDVYKIEGYRGSVTQLRNALAAEQKTCDIQTTKSNPKTGEEYLWVELKDGAKVVTLGIDVKDGYVLGYQDMYEGAYRANLLKSDDNKKDVVDPKKLFPGATKQRSTGFNGQYGTLENKSGKTRMSIELTFDSLSRDIQAIYGKKPNAVKTKDTARFFLRAIQFVSEAARFKFIEDVIATQKEPVGFRDKLKAYENSWDKISQAIHMAASSTTDKCGDFPKPLTINDKVLKKVDDVKGDMGLLKHKKLTTTAAITSIPLADDAAQEYLLEFA